MELLTLETQAELALDLLYRSTADATLIFWIEGSSGEFLESSRSRRASLLPRRSIEVAVRWHQRTGRAHLGSTEPGQLRSALRQAIAAAAAQEPSPDWEAGAQVGESVLDRPTSDPLLFEWSPQRTRELLSPWIQSGTSLKLRWAALRVVAATSLGVLRKAELTGVTAEVRKGPRPGSGFAARSARTLAELRLEELIERAAGRQASRCESFEGGMFVPLVVGPEAAVVLLEALGRLALGSHSPPLAEGEDLRWSPTLEVRDDPFSLPGLPLTFDAEGFARKPSPAIVQGKRALRSLDHDRAALETTLPTGHALGGGLAWPIHLALANSGGLEEDQLWQQAPGGVRIGSVEELSLEPWPPYRFSTRARSVRKIGPDGRLGAAVGPLIWESSLAEVFGSIQAWGIEATAWSHPSVEALGAARCPALALAPIGVLRPDARL